MLSTKSRACTRKHEQGAHTCSDASGASEVCGARAKGPADTAAPTWLAEAFVAGAHAAAAAVRAGAERAEVHPLRAGRPGEARAAAAAEARAVRVAGGVVLARRRGARVHLLLAGGAQVSCGGARAEGEGQDKGSRVYSEEVMHGVRDSFSPLGTDEPINSGIGSNYAQSN